MALSHFGARHFAAWHFGTLHGQAAAATTSAPVHRRPWIHQQPLTRRVRTRAWAERDEYGRCRARQTPPLAKPARAVAVVEAECFGETSARAVYRAATRSLSPPDTAGVSRARAQYHARAAGDVEVQAFPLSAARRGLPDRAVLMHFLREIA